MGSLPERGRIAGGGASIALLSLLLPLAAGCKSEEKKQTPAEWLEENTFILDQLRSYERKERQEAINRFLRLGRDQGTAVVNYILNDSGLQSWNDYRLEVVLARILAEWKDSRAIPHLLRNLKGTDSGAIAIVKEGLIAFGENSQILESMEELLKESDGELRRTAAEVLSEMKGPAAVQLLSQQLKTEETVEIRGLCLLGILSSRDPRRTEYLVEALADKDPGIRKQAWMAVAAKKPPLQFDPYGDPAAREKAVEGLRKWILGKGKGKVSGGDSGNAAKG